MLHEVHLDTSKAIADRLSEGFIFTDHKGQVMLEMIGTKRAKCKNYSSGPGSAAIIRKFFDDGLCKRTLVIFPGCGPAYYFHSKKNAAVKKYAVKITYLNRPKKSFKSR